jgi:hypothetical protein
MKRSSDRFLRLAFPAAALAAGIAIGSIWHPPAPAPAPEVFRASPTELLEPDNPGHIVLLPLRGHRDEAIVRAIFAANPDLPNLDKLSSPDDAPWGPDSEGWDPGLPFHGERFLYVYVGRHFVPLDRIFSEEPQPDIFVLINSPDTCGYNDCEAFAAGFEDGKWRHRFGLYGTIRNGYGVVVMAGVPLEARVHESTPPWRYGPPFVVQPVNDGRPTFIWRTGGVYWDGKEWSYFCWDQCRDR